MPLQLEIPKMTCSSCIKTITNAIKTVDANADVQVDLKTKLIVVNSPTPEITSRELIAELAIRESLAKIGYPAVA